MALWLALNPGADADEAVRSAQSILKSAGYYSGEATGELDAETKTALRRYQIRNGLQPTGELSPETVTALNKEGEEQPPAPQPAAAQPSAPVTPSVPVPSPMATPVPSTQPVPPPPAAAPPDAEYARYYARTPYAAAPLEVQRETMRRAQAVLAERRLYAGAVNGTPNPETEEALLRLQASRDLPRTGVLDIDTLAELHLLPVKKPRLRELPPGAVRGVPLD